MKTEEVADFGRKWLGSRPFFLLALLLAYVIPLSFIFYLAIQTVAPSLFWSLATGGTVTLFFGAVTLYLLAPFGEASINKQASVPEPALYQSMEEEDFPLHQQTIDDLERKLGLLHHDLFVKEDQLQQFLQEKELWEQKWQNFMEEGEQRSRSQKEEIERLNRFVQELKATINEQRSAMELNLERVSQLECKNDDLRYEIKTLLQVTQNSLKLDHEEGAKDETSYQAKPRESVVIPDRPVRTLEEASVELRRCLELTQKFSGSSHASGASRYKNVPAGGFALDMRQLFEALRQEQSAMILFYSWNESKPLFVNSVVKTFLGWSPEVFIQKFPEIIADGIQEWRHSLSDLRTKGETLTRLVLKDRSGDDLIVHCLLGRVQNGQFKNHVIAVFYP